jgi:thioredoxin
VHLTTGENGEQDYDTLLDELNAYTTGLNTAYALREGAKLSGADAWRDQVAALMRFNEAYLSALRAANPQLWSRLALSDHARILLSLWNMAERSLNQACSIPGLGRDDGEILRQVYDHPNFDEIERIATFRASRGIPTAGVSKKGVPACGVSPLALGAVLNLVTDAQFTEQVVDSPALSLVEFKAPWCAPCKALRPILEKIALANKGRLHVVTLDTDAAPETADHWGVKSLPQLSIFLKGQKVGELAGFRTEAELLEFLRPFLSAH